MQSHTEQISPAQKQLTIEDYQRLNARLQNQVESDRAYIKALEEECRITHELIGEYKKRIDSLSADLINAVKL